MIVYNICLFIDSFIFFLILRQSGTKISETLSFFLIILPAPPPPLHNVEENASQTSSTLFKRGGGEIYKCFIIFVPDCLKKKKFKFLVQRTFKVILFK